MSSRVDLTESELQIMQVVWSSDGISAKQVVAALAESPGYSASIKKGALERSDAGFSLRPLVSREQVQNDETKRLADRLFDGSIDSLFAALIDRHEVSPGILAKLRTAIDAYEKGDD